MTDCFTKTGAVFRREFFSLLGSAAAWVFLVIFLAGAGFLTFIVSDILSLGQADLGPFFNWMPWLFLFVVPALAMPLWSEERRTGTLELSLSYPVSIAELVAGKFLAGLALLAFALLLTAGTPLTILAFGKPDVSAIFCGYAGALMTGAVFLAVSCFCSAMTRSQTASFLLSLLLCALLMFTGWDKVSDQLAQYLPQSVCRWISGFAIIPHYQAFQRGLLDSSEIVYSLLTTLLFLYLTASALAFSASGIGGLFLPGAMSDRYTWKQLGRLSGGVAAALYIYLCLIYAASVVPVRFDATSDQAYSLTRQSKRIAAELDQPVEMRFYLSGSESGMPRPLLQYGERVEWLLRDFARAAKGKVRLTVIRPEQDSADEEAAMMDGLVPVHKTPTGDRFYLGVAVSRGMNTIPLKALTPDREALLEYDLVRAVQNVTRKHKPVLGVISSFSVLGKKSFQPGVPEEKPLDFASELAKDYQLREIPLDSAVIPENISALLVYHPSGIALRTQYAIDQYLMRGGKTLIFLDPRLGRQIRKNSDVGSADMQTQLQQMQSDLNKLLPAWGIDYNAGTMAADMNFKFNPAPMQGLHSVQPNILMITDGGISRNSPVTAALTRLFMVYPGAFPIRQEIPGLRYETLVYTTPYAKLYSVTAKPNDVFADLGSDPNAANGIELPLVLSVSGSFRTAFPSGAPDAASGDNGQKHRNLSEGHPEVILVADSDMLLRSANTEYRTDSDGQRTPVYWNDNITLLQNALEHLTGTESLSLLRTRTPMSRPLTKIAESRSKVEVEYNERYSTLLENYKKSLARVQAIRRKQVSSGNRAQLTEEERKILTLFVRQEADFRREEKAIRNSLKEGLDAINSRARTVNIVLIPGAVILLGIGWGILRRTRRKGGSRI